MSDRTDGESRGVQHTPQTGLPFGGPDILYIAAIAATVLLMGLPGITTDGLGWSDAPQHTFDGIFVLEFFKQLPLDNPRAWAEQFYFKYPSIGIFVYYPPGFAAVEAVVFAIFGVGVVTARATVLLFAFGAGILIYGLGRRWFDRPTGLLAALLLLTCPHGGLWLNDVMLEWPATFWILAAVYAYEMDRETRRTRWSIACGAAVTLAFLTKQTAGFILPVLLVHALISRPPGSPRRQAAVFSNAVGAAPPTARLRTYWRRPAFIASLLAALAIITGYWLATRRIAALPAALLQPSIDLLFYPRRLAEILGWPLLPIALLGLGTLIVEPDRKSRGLLLLWFLAWAGFCTLIAAKEPRYFFFALPPLVFAAVRFFLPAAPAGERERPLTFRTDAARLALLVALVVTQAALFRARWTGQPPSYSPAVAALTERPDADLVLVDAVRDGQFILDIYRDPRARGKIIPLRASKLLYARAARTQYDYQQFVNSPQDIVDLLDEYGIRYVVIESALPRTHYVDADPPPRRMLRELLAGDPRFRLVQSWPLRCSDPIWDDVELRLYEYPSCPPRSSSTIKLSFPGMNREVTFQLP